MRRGTSLFIHGALAGALGAASMTVLRSAARRAGWIEVMVPQAVEVWLAERAPLARPRTAATHHVAEQLLHLGYGAFWGGVYGLVAPGPANARRALTFGGAIWALGTALLFPALKIARPPWRAKPREELVNVGAHVLYGAVTSLLLEELERQGQRPRLTRRRVLVADVG